MLLPSFPPRFSACVSPRRSKKSFPVVRMNHPVGDFTASSGPLTLGLVLVQMTLGSFLPSPPPPCPQRWSPHLFPEVCFQRIWYPECDLCFSLSPPSVILMRFSLHMLVMLVGINHHCAVSKLTGHWKPLLTFFSNDFPNSSRLG